MSTVYGIVKQHQGFVWAYSEPGVGTSIRIYLPASPAVVTVPAEARDDGGPVGVPGVRTGAALRTVLVVEDDAAIRVLARRALEGSGYHVIEAEHGRRAMEILADGVRKPDLVISDVIMPEMNGRELGQALGRLHADLPVLYTSGYAGDEVARRGLMPERAPFLQKPFTMDDLVRRVEDLLGHLAGGSPHGELYPPPPVRPRPLDSGDQ